MVAAGIAYDPVVDDGAGGVDMIAEQITAPEKSLETVSLSAPRIEVTQLHHQYDTRRVLDGIDLAVAPGEIVALLGPNGSGKTTLFRILSTLMPPQHGVVRIDGHDVATDSLAARGKFGVIFQSPGLDGQLSVIENLSCQGVLYGMSGQALRTRCDELLDRFGLTDRRTERCQTLSGGLKRRVELAKGLLHRPRVLLLDEPSTGLDPAARRSLWSELRLLADDGVAVLLTTHLMEEAEKADRVAMLFDGRKVADDSPAELRRQVGDTILTITADDPISIQSRLRSEFQLETRFIDGRLQTPCDSPRWASDIAMAFGDAISSVTIGRPGLADVFMSLTGQAWDAEMPESPKNTSGPSARSRRGA